MVDRSDLVDDVEPVQDHRDHADGDDPEDDGGVSVIDISTHTVLDTIAVDDWIGGIAISPDGARVYVTSVGSVLVIDASTNEVVATIAVDGWKGDVAIAEVRYPRVQFRRTTAGKVDMRLSASRTRETA